MLHAVCSGGLREGAIVPSLHNYKRMDVAIYWYINIIIIGH